MPFLTQLIAELNTLTRRAEEMEKSGFRSGARFRAMFEGLAEGIVFLKTDSSYEEINVCLPVVLPRGITR